MFIKWKKTPYKGDRYHPSCTHTGPGVLLSPIATFSFRAPGSKHPQHMHVWRPGPGIRQCCLNDPMTQAAWWAAVKDSFSEIDRTDLFGSMIWTERGDLLHLLALKVPKPPLWAARRVASWMRSQKPVKGPPPCVELLGLPWPFTEQELKSRWRPIALANHPDRGGDETKFKVYNAAYSEARDILFPG